jgi:hypothetical protein
MLITIVNEANETETAARGPEISKAVRRRVERDLGGPMDYALNKNHQIMDVQPLLDGGARFMYRWEV